MSDKVTKIYLLFLLPLGIVAAIVAILLYQIGVQSGSFGVAGLSVICFGMMIRRYLSWVNEIRAMAASSETAERFRAEQAETHLRELQHYVDELERSSKALSESRESFKYAAYHDSLTGLANRNNIVEVLKESLARLSRDPSKRFVVLCIDLDRFKTVNDSLGHAQGDRLIKIIAERLSSLVDGMGIVGRFSGDEFSIVLQQENGEPAEEEFARAMIREISREIDLNGRKIVLGASIGIAAGSTMYSDPNELLRDADISMYYAKENNCDFAVFDQIMHARAVILLDLETDLRQAVERNEFELFYQPLICLDDASLVGFEALVRWNHPKRGLITPSEFITVAESTGLMIPMTLGLLRSACQQMSKWRAQGLAPERMMMSVNLSASHLLQPRIVDQIREILFETSADPENLKLEITESALMKNAEASISVLRKIKDLGVKISIDDFGTGYSSLSYLHRLPIDILKIDRSFVSTMEDGSGNGEIVRTVIALAKTLKLDVIAEGIENIHQFHQLRILGCEYGQGFLFSRPLHAKTAEALLADPGRWGNILPSDEFGVIARNLEYTQMRIQ